MIDIGVDLDECLYDFVGMMREWLKLQGHDHPMPEPVDWLMSKQWGLTRDEFVKAMQSGVDDEFLFAEGTPIRGTRLSMERLIRCGRVHLVTNRDFGPQGRLNTLHWLSDWSIPYDSLHFVHNKAIEGPACHVYIDDRPRNYDWLEKAGMNPYLMDQPWNRSHPGRRVQDLAGFATIVEKEYVQ